jgi:hypothetical protein
MGLRPAAGLGGCWNGFTYVFNSRRAAEAIVAIDSWNLHRQHLTAMFRNKRVQEWRTQGMSLRVIAETAGRMNGRCSVISPRIRWGHCPHLTQHGPSTQGVHQEVSPTLLPPSRNFLGDHETHFRDIVSVHRNGQLMIELSWVYRFGPEGSDRGSK